MHYSAFENNSGTLSTCGTNNRYYLLGNSTENSVC